jgi:hypothetical protein
VARPELAALAIGDPPERWEALGFDVRGGAVDLGGVSLELAASGKGIAGWALRGLAGSVTDIDGLPTTTVRQSAAATPQNRRRAAPHPNGAVGLDHVVILTGDFDRTAAALAAHGMPLRREAERNGARQGFRRLGPAIMELVAAPQAPPGPASFWGLVIVVGDLAALAGRLGERLSEPRAAVQPGRHIATLRQSAGLTPAVAFMDPE